MEGQLYSVGNKIISVLRCRLPRPTPYFFMVVGGAVCFGRVRLDANPLGVEILQVALKGYYWIAKMPRDGMG